MPGHYSDNFSMYNEINNWKNQKIFLKQNKTINNNNIFLLGDFNFNMKL